MQYQISIELDQVNVEVRSTATSSALLHISGLSFQYVFYKYYQCFAHAQ